MSSLELGTQSDLFDYLIPTCHWDLDKYSIYFLGSMTSQRFSGGNAHLSIFRSEIPEGWDLLLISSHSGSFVPEHSRHAHGFSRGWQPDSQCECGHREVQMAQMTADLRVGKELGFVANYLESQLRFNAF